jgi:hypothetical protein
VSYRGKLTRTARSASDRGPAAARQPTAIPLAAIVSGCRHRCPRIGFASLTWYFIAQGSTDCPAESRTYPRRPGFSRAAVGPPLGPLAVTGGTRCRAKPIARSAAACRSQERLWAADSGSGSRTCRLEGRTRNQCRARPALAVTGNGPPRPVAAPSGSVRHRERNGHGMLSPDRPFFRPRMPSVETTAKRGGLLSSGRGRRGLLFLLSSLLSAAPRRWVLSTWPVEPPLLAAASGLTPCFPWRALTYLAHLDPVRRTRRVRVHTRSRRSEAQLRQEGSKQAMRVMLMIKGDKEPVGLDYSVWPGQTSRAGIIAE